MSLVLGKYQNQVLRLLCSSLQVHGCERHGKRHIILHGRSRRVLDLALRFMTLLENVFLPCFLGLFIGLCVALGRTQSMCRRSLFSGNMCGRP